MIEKVRRITKVKRIRKLGLRKCVTMKGLYYREMINRIFNNKKKINKKNTHENKPFKEYLTEEKHLLDKRV